MSYPLLFPKGDLGFKLKMQHVGDRKTKSRNEITFKEFYNYRLSLRNNEFNPLFFSGPLTQQYMIDAYCKIEANRLNYLRHNQASLRVDKYKVVSDFLKDGNNQNPGTENPSLGVPVILPSSYDRSPRSQIMRYQDAIAVVSKFGRPDLFVTVTCNPKWPEIINNLQHGQTTFGAPHLLSRVFKLYLNAIIKKSIKRVSLEKLLHSFMLLSFKSVVYHMLTF